MDNKMGLENETKKLAKFLMRPIVTLCAIAIVWGTLNGCEPKRATAQVKCKTTNDAQLSKDDIAAFAGKKLEYCIANCDYSACIAEFAESLSRHPMGPMTDEERDSFVWSRRSAHINNYIKENYPDHNVRGIIRPDGNSVRIREY